ncbi:MAG: sugar transferase [Anaerolineales bacterium]
MIPDQVNNHQRAQTDFSWLGNITPIISGRAYPWIKRFLDILITLIFSPIWVPLIGLIYILIKIESPAGPAFFIQDRTGKNGRRFKLYKFRTMVENAEELKDQLWHLNELEWPDFKITDDPRITKIGKILRKTSLDELPQLFNILIGDMSLVGPRPTFFSSEDYDIWQTERLDIAPGLTGLWQLYGRGEVIFDDRARMDILYVQYCSLGLDFYILFKTPFVVIKQKGAK